MNPHKAEQEIKGGHKALYTTPNPYERKYGFHRAVRKGPFIFVSGTTATHPISGQVLNPQNAYMQAIVTYGECIKAVKALGARGPEDVVRVRTYVAVSIATSVLLPLEGSGAILLVIASRVWRMV